MKKLMAYKVFNPDWKCRNFQYEVGKTYKHEGKAELCSSGFHACEQVADCFNYQSFDPNNKVAVVELSGEIIKGDDKCVASQIKIVKEVSWSEMLTLANTGKGNTGIRNSGDRNSGDSNSGNSNSGYRNSGYGNSGDRNSGDSNSGYRNSGYGNSGDRNSGYGNSGDRNSGYGNSGYGNSGNSNSGYGNSGYSNSGYSNSGYSNSGYGNSGVFCSKQQHDCIDMFNKPSTWTWNDWRNSRQCSLVYGLTITQRIAWANMTDEEKASNPKAFVTEGYVKVYEYKEAWGNLWKTFSQRDKDSFKELPNFDQDVFEFITGIKI